MFINVAAKVNA